MLVAGCGCPEFEFGGREAAVAEDSAADTFVTPIDSGMNLEDDTAPTLDAAIDVAPDGATDAGVACARRARAVRARSANKSRPARRSPAATPPPSAAGHRRTRPWPLSASSMCADERRPGASRVELRPMEDGRGGAPPAGTIKRCVCGRHWDASSWRDLPYVGLQEFEQAPRLELRQCDKCGSTLARRLDG